MTSSPGFTVARSVAIIASVDPQQTVTCRSASIGDVVVPLHVRPDRRAQRTASPT